VDLVGDHELLEVDMPLLPMPGIAELVAQIAATADRVERERLERKRRRL